MIKHMIKPSMVAALLFWCASAWAAEPLCKPDARKLIPSREELIKLCPKDPLFGGTPTESENGKGGCLLTWSLPSGGSVSISATDLQVGNGAKAGADAAARAMGGSTQVKRAPFKGLEAYQLTGMPGYYVGAGKTVLAVTVKAVLSAGPSPDCTEAVVREVARRGARE